MPELPYRFIEALESLPYVEAIWLYGSRARGTHAPRADIDIAVYCPQADVLEWDCVMQRVEEADTLLEIDCVRLDELPEKSSLRQNIEREGKLIYERSASA